MGAAPVAAGSAPTAVTSSADALVVSAVHSLTEAKPRSPIGEIVAGSHKGKGSEDEKDPLAHADAQAEEQEARGRKLWHKAFQKLKEDGEVHHDDLPQALELAGFSQPDSHCVEDAFTEVSPHYTTLDEEQFEEFVRRYTKHLDEAYMEAFTKYDCDGSGKVEAEELQAVLTTFGIMPLRHVLHEVLKEVDEDGEGALSREEFKTLMELIRVREGFTKFEYEEFRGLFHRFDRDRSGEIDTGELQSILSWIGYCTSKDKTAEIVKAVDSNRSGTVSFGEMLVCMRKVREDEVKTISEVVRKYDTDGSNTISGKELQHVLEALGYHADWDAVNEAVVEVGLDPEEGELDLSDIVRLLSVFRKQEGFLSSEVTAMDEAFTRFDREKLGEISTLEVGKVLRYLGYTTPYEVQQTFISRVDIDGSGMISLPELKKLLRMIQARELGVVDEVFQSLDTDGRGYITLEDANEGFARLKCMDADGKPPKVMPKDFYKGPVAKDDQDAERRFISSEGFVHTVSVFQREARRAFKDNSGFSQGEIKELRKRFNFYDGDSSGEIGRKELIALIEEIFPSMASDAAVRPRLKQMMAEVDSDGSGSLDFKDFMRLMEGLREMELKDQRDKELKAVEQTGFSNKEVDEFRELFLSTGDGCSTLDFKELCSMLRTICPLGDKNIKELRSHWEEITGRHMQTIHEGQDSRQVEGAELDFPEYLRLMHRLLDVDFASLKARIGG